MKSAIAIDSLPASQYFLQGQILKHPAILSQRTPHFIAPKNLTDCAFAPARCSTRLSKNLANPPALELCRFGKMFEAQSPGNLPGKALLLEHLHPNVDGYLLMATTFAESIIQSGALRRASRGDAAGFAVAAAHWR
ncbi:MAG: hypothetical protein R3C26_23055 [Calditrichia bacterium]